MVVLRGWGSGFWVNRCVGQPRPEAAAGRFHTSPTTVLRKNALDQMVEEFDAQAATANGDANEGHIMGPFGVIVWGGTEQHCPTSRDGSVSKDFAWGVK